MNYTVAVSGFAIISSGDTCGAAMCWTGGSGTYQFDGFNHCVPLDPPSQSPCAIQLGTGSFVSRRCGTATLVGDPSGAFIDINGITHTILSYSMKFQSGQGTFQGITDDGSSVTGVVELTPDDSNGEQVEGPVPAEPGDGACANGFRLAGIVEG